MPNSRACDCTPGVSDQNRPDHIAHKVGDRRSQCRLVQAATDYLHELGTTLCSLCLIGEPLVELIVVKEVYRRLGALLVEDLTNLCD